MLFHIRLPDIPRSAGKWYQFPCHILGRCCFFHPMVGYAITYLFFKSPFVSICLSLQEMPFNYPVSPKVPSHTT